jgi:hypothetical protein
MRQHDWGEDSPQPTGGDRQRLAGPLQFWQVILIGFVLELVGCLFPFLMVIKVIPASFALSFLSYAASVVGLVLGLIAATWYVLGRRRKP